MTIPHHSKLIENAFQHCEELVRSHYENFPVASFFLPKNLRPYVAAVYAFARTADDFADEGNRSPEERLAALDDWQNNLDACYEGKANHPIFIALAEVVQRKNVPKQLLSDLLTAFKMDVTTRCYQSYDELLFYCQYSANPVGRLVLHLFDDVSDRHCQLSDNICTGLQLTNFWQDIRIDYAKGRTYLPLEDMGRFGYTEGEFSRQLCDNRWRKLMAFEIERTRQLFEAGRPLLNEAVPALQFELGLTWHGGMMILNKIEQADYSVFANRPTIGTLEKILIVAKSVVQKAV